jgi:hypothetical protein
MLFSAVLRLSAVLTKGPSGVACLKYAKLNQKRNHDVTIGGLMIFQGNFTVHLHFSVMKFGYKSLFTVGFGLAVSAGSIGLGFIFTQPVFAAQYRIQFDADSIPADLLITTEDILSTVSGFTGYKIIDISGTDGGDTVLGLYPQGFSSLSWGGVAVDNLFNYIPGLPTQPNQFSSSGFAYYTSDNEAYRFFYGERLGVPGSSVSYQGFPVRPRPTPIDPNPIPFDPGNYKDITNPRFNNVVPGPLPILGVGAAFGFSRKLRKRIKSGESPDIMNAIG